MKINSNHTNLAFDREINNSEAWFQNKIFDVGRFASKVLTDRLMQRFVEIFLTPYVTRVSLLCKQGKDCFPASGTKLMGGCASLEIGTGRVTVTIKQFLSHMFGFLLHWAYCFFAILATKASNKSNLPAVLFYGVGEESIFVENSDERFVNYCRLGPIEPLRKGGNIFIETSSNHVSSDHCTFEYCKRPLIRLLREASIGGSCRFKLLVNHLILFFEYLVAVIRLPQLSLLGKDFAYSEISSELDRQGFIESIVLTCSNYTSQPLWLRGLSGAKVHMVWYAQSWKQIRYVSDKLSSDRPSLRWIRSDIHWVWTRVFADYLSNLGLGGKFEVVGPIVWYMPEVSSPDPKVLQIAIFDVPPFSDEIAFAIGQFSNYNHPDNLFLFIKDILSLKEELEKRYSLPIRFCLKTKRGYKAGYDLEYFDHLEKLASEEAISLVHYSTNMYSLISESHLVICYPFTSPAEIASTLSVLSVFYDPTGSIVCQDSEEPDSLIKLISNPDDLLGVVSEITSAVLDE